MGARLPKGKLAELDAILHKYVCRKKSKIKAIAIFIGTFKFCIYVIKPGRCFLRRLYDLTCGKVKLDHYIKLNMAARADLKVWVTFIYHNIA